MQNKNNNQKHWKDKLEETSSFPYAPVNKELAWQKLSTRLQKKKRRKVAIWYWSAAACLLPLIFFMLFRNEHQEISTAKNDTHKPAVSKPSVTIKQKPEEIAVVSSTQQPVINKKESQPRKQRDEIATIGRKEIQPPIDSIATNNTSAIVSPKDSTNNMASFMPSQKSKLTVVHINELNEPYESLPVMAHNANYPRFLPLQFARESIFPEPVKAINKTGFINLRNKSSN